MVYQQCGPSCPQTCDNYDNPECGSGCVEGCFCPSETILSYGYCINVSYCQGILLILHTYALHILSIFLVLNVTNVSITAPSTQIVGQSLTLECSVTTVRGITSRVDIVWSSDDIELTKIKGVTVNSTLGDSAIYKSSYTVQVLSTYDSERVYECTMVINTDPPVLARSIVTLDLTGKGI